VRDGELDLRYPTKRVDADKARLDREYRAWLHRPMPEVPRESVLSWIEDLRDAHGDMEMVANAAGVTDRLLRRLMLEGGTPKFATVDRLALAAGKLHELSSLIAQETGADGWSEAGRYCGDGCSYDGCGTWFHRHLAEGLCEECYYRELHGVGPELPRDVRETQRGRVR
jgi:DNA-binding phage protein